MDKELEDMQHNNRLFLVNCALLKKTSKQIDKYIYQVESIRREVLPLPK